MSGLSDFFQTNPLYPFRFEPVYKHYLWGGSRLKELFNRSMNSEADCTAESWEVTDHPHGQSVVKNGQLRGTTLNDIVQYAPTKLFGQETVNSDVPPKQFPLLFKYLDAKQTLSVQVHPDIETVGKLQLNDNEKNECWLVAEAEPDSFLYLGTGKKYSKEELEQQIRQGNWEKFLNRVNVRKGDCFFIPAGTVHALGAGILVAEVQTVSDLTFRLFDWNRLDANGNPRELHLEPGIQSIHTPTFPIRTEQPVRAKHKHCEQMLDSPWFSLDRWTLDKPILWNNDERCHIWTVLEGSADAVFTAGRRFAESVVSGRAADPDGIETLNRGDTLLIPAVCQYIRWVPEQKKNTVLLDVTVKFI